MYILEGRLVDYLCIFNLATEHHSFLYLFRWWLCILLDKILGNVIYKVIPGHQKSIVFKKK